MPKDEAKAFLNSRKKGGYISREVHVELAVILDKHEVNKGFTGHLVWVKVWNDEMHKKLLTEFKAPAS